MEGVDCRRRKVSGAGTTLRGRKVSQGSLFSDDLQATGCAECRRDCARPVEPEDLLALKTLADVQLSPDGRRVAFVLNELDAAEDAVRSSIWVVETTSGRLSRFTRGPGKDSAPRWSPDGRALAFLSDRPPHRNGGEQPQLYLVPSDGGEARRLTDLEEGAGPASWSPDGTRLAFAARVPRATAPEASGRGGAGSSAPGWSPGRSTRRTGRASRSTPSPTCSSSTSRH